MTNRQTNFSRIILKWIKNVPSKRLDRGVSSQSA